MTNEQFTELLFNISNASFSELNDKTIKAINFRILSSSPETIVAGKKLKTWNYEAITELNLRSYEGKLYRKNLKNLGPISRNKYNRLVKFSELLFTDIFSEKKNKFQSLQILSK